MSLYMPKQDTRGVPPMAMLEEVTARNNRLMGFK